MKVKFQLPYNLSIVPKGIKFAISIHIVHERVWNEVILKNQILPPPIIRSVSLAFVSKDTIWVDGNKIASET